MIIKQYIKKIIYRERASSDAYIDFLRKKGCSIGCNTRFFDPKGTEVDITKPELIHIGNNVQITSGCKIVSHGFDWYVLNGVYGDILGSAGEINIGDNVFIGINSVILKGTTIGNNVIIGAGSIVNHNIPNNSVAAGNPAKVICGLEEYYQKRKSCQLSEALVLYMNYKRKYGKRPNKSYFHEFFWLFEHSNNGRFNIDKFNYEMNIGNRKERTIRKYLMTNRIFTSFDQFCEWCDEHKESDFLQ